MFISPFGQFQSNKGLAISGAPELSQNHYQLTMALSIHQKNFQCHNDFKQVTSSPYYPRRKGESERAVRTF